MDLGLCKTKNRCTIIYQFNHQSIYEKYQIHTACNCLFQFADCINGRFGLRGI